MTRIRGGGSLRERRSGVWEVRVSLGADPVSGRSRVRSLTIHGDREVAEAARDGWAADAAGVRFAGRPRHTCPRHPRPRPTTGHRDNNRGTRSVVRVAATPRRTGSAGGFSFWLWVALAGDLRVRAWYGTARKSERRFGSWAQTGRRGWWRVGSGGSWNDTASRHGNVQDLGSYNRRSRNFESNLTFRDGFGWRKVGSARSKAQRQRT
jgi:hypothetical protein